MNIKEYIASGILEQYVAGTLSDKEMNDVYDNSLKHPEIHSEILSIENAIIKLIKIASPKKSNIKFEVVEKKLDLETKVISISRTRNKWVAYSGWAASVLLFAGLSYTINQNNKLNTITGNLEQQIELANEDLANVNKLNKMLRDNDILKITLTGQKISPDSYASVYWDKKSDKIYLDVQGLPDPPKGKVYQVWSLALNPLTPTDLGVINDFSTDKNKIFEIKNTNQSQAFGITLEPIGGSKSPTLEQLYTLGVVDVS